MIRQKQNSDKMIIDLDGPEGNAYNLLGVANNLMRKGFGRNALGRDIADVLKEMTGLGPLNFGLKVLLLYGYLAY